jgi:transposase
MAGAGEAKIMAAASEKEHAVDKSKQEPVYYSKEFRQSAVELVVKQGYKPAQAARNLGIKPKYLYRWLYQGRKAQARQTPGTLEALQVENKCLLEQVRRLQMERDILKKAATYFASQNLSDSTSSTRTPGSST